MEIRRLVGGTATVCGSDVTLVDAAQVMLDHHIGSIGVVDEGKLVGILTDRDLLRAVAAGADRTATVLQWMTPEPDVVGPEVEVQEAADWLLATGYRHLPVVENGELLGILSIKDILWALEGR